MMNLEWHRDPGFPYMAEGCLYHQQEAWFCRWGFILCDFKREQFRGFIRFNRQSGEWQQFTTTSLDEAKRQFETLDELNPWMGGLR